MMNGTSVRDEVIGDNENTTINHEINQVEELQQQEQQGLLTDGEVDPVEPRVYHELTVNKSFKEANGTMSISTSIHGITSSLNGTTSGSTTSLYTSQGISRQEQEAITISSSMRLLNDLSGFMSTEGIRNKSSLEKGQQQQLTSRTGQGNYGKDIYAEGGHKCHEEENQERGEELTIVEEEVWSDKDPITNCHEREDVRGPVRDQPQLEHDYDDTPDEEESRTDDEDRISENEIIQIKDATPESERQSNDMSEGPSPSVLQMHLQKPQQHLTQKVNDSRRQVAVPREANTRAMIRPLPLLPAQAVTSSATYGASQGFPFYSDKNPSYPVESRDQMRDDPNTASNHSVTGPPMLRSYNDYIDNISPPPAAVSSYQCDSSCTHPDHGATAINSNNKYQRMLREDRMRYMMTNQRFPYYSDGGSFPSPIIPSNYSANYSSPVSHQIVPQSTVFSSTSPIATSRMMNNRDPRPSIQDPRTTPVKRVTPEVTNPPNEVASPSMSNIGRRTPANVNPFKRKQRQEHSTSACSSPIDSSAHFHFPAPQFPPWSPYYVSPSAINFSSNPMLLYNPYLPKSQVGLVPPPLLNCMCIECQQVRIVNSGPVSPNGDNYGSRNWNPKSQFDSFNPSPADGQKVKALETIEEQPSIPKKEENGNQVESMSSQQTQSTLLTAGKKAFVEEWLHQNPVSVAPSPLSVEESESTPTKKRRRVTDRKGRRMATDTDTVCHGSNGGARLIPFYHCPKGCGSIPMQTLPPCCVGGTIVSRKGGPPHHPPPSPANCQGK